VSQSLELLLDQPERANANAVRVPFEPEPYCGARKPEGGCAARCAVDAVLLRQEMTMGTCAGVEKKPFVPLPCFVSLSFEMKE
jgi:hypothetical protein